MKAIKLISNLGFVSNYGLEVNMVDDTTIDLNFSTGFKAVCKKIAGGLGHENNIDVYEYQGNNEVNYLHIRKNKSLWYCQTVQGGMSPGGSTFQIIP